MSSKTACNDQGIRLGSRTNIRICLTHSYFFYCDENVILQIIYTPSAFELPVGPSPALVSTPTSPLSASIALSSGFASTVRNLSA